MNQRSPLSLCPLALFGLTALAMAGCAPEPEDDPTDPSEETSETQQASSFIDLKIGGVTIEANGVFYPVQQHGSLTLPCGAKQIRVHYTYENVGNLTAPAHQHTFQYATPMVSMKPVGSIQGGIGIFASFTRDISNVPVNTFYTMNLKIDDPNVVAELTEDNNAFSMSLRRSCIIIPI